MKARRRNRRRQAKAHAGAAWPPPWTQFGPTVADIEHGRRLAPRPAEANPGRRMDDPTGRPGTTAETLIRQPDCTQDGRFPTRKAVPAMGLPRPEEQPDSAENRQPAGTALQERAVK